MTSAYDAGTIPPIRLHHRLRIAREWAQLEQSELAELIGISRNSVSTAERGVTQPRRITLNAWAFATGVPVTWLQTGHGPTGGSPDGPAAGDGDGQPATCGLKVRQRRHVFSVGFSDAA